MNGVFQDCVLVPKRFLISANNMMDRNKLCKLVSILFTTL